MKLSEVLSSEDLREFVLGITKLVEKHSSDDLNHNLIIAQILQEQARSVANKNKPEALSDGWLNVEEGQPPPGQRVDGKNKNGQIITVMRSGNGFFHKGKPVDIVKWRER